MEMISPKKQTRSAHPYEVFNLLTGEWGPLVSPHRFQRPWQGQVESHAEEDMPEHDKTCYLCPGNIRNTGEKNPKYAGTWFFTNDFSALLAPGDDAPQEDSTSPFFQRRPDSGICEVLLYSPLHNRPMNTLGLDQLTQIVKLWKNRYEEIGNNPDVNHIQIFENRGSEMGASNPHPHGQLWAQENLPSLSAAELTQQSAYFEKRGKPLLVEYAEAELGDENRIVSQNEHFVTLVPFWAVWPYETMILPKAHRTGLDKLTEDEISGLAESLSQITKTYAELFNRPKYGAPYTMGIHQRPTDGKEHVESQLHIHFEPPLLTPDRQKYMVGYERFAQAQRDITTEKAAEVLRETLQKINSSSQP